MNRDTPFLQVNGRTDLAVTYWPAATKTRDSLKEVFTKHTFESSMGSHATTMFSPNVQRKIRNWVHRYTNL